MEDIATFVIVCALLTALVLTLCGYSNQATHGNATAM
jgi:hypothetical protein